MDRSQLLASFDRLWHHTYLPDYAGYLLLQMLYLLQHLLIRPFHRLFSLSDLSIQYPFAVVQRVSGIQNILYAGLAPLAFLIAWSLIGRFDFHKLHLTLLGLIISLTLTSVLTDLIKNSVGRPRPDLIARCAPAPGTLSSALVSIEVCTSTDEARLQDGWRSFPSGHSSFSFAGLGYLTLWLAGQMHVLRPRMGLHGVVLAGLPVVGATMIAMSRMADYRHDVYDVVAGSSLGMAIAWFSYRRYFRPLRSAKCERPWPSKAEMATKGDGRVRGARDEEEQMLKHADEFELDSLGTDEEEEENIGHTKANGKAVDDR